MNTSPSGPGRPVPPRAARPRFSVRRTRIGGWWVSLVAAALVLLLLLIFVLQNSRSVRVSFLGAHANLPVGIALLLAATAGVLIVAIPGTGRIIQLRRLAQQQARPDPPASLSPPVGQPADQPKMAAPADGEAIAPDPQDQRHE